MAAMKEEIGRISSLSVQLETTKETLRKVEEALAAKEVDLEAAGKTVSDVRACLQEKERVLGVTSQQLQELLSQLGSRMQELQHPKDEEGCIHRVQAECETLNLQVLDKERIMEIFQKQMDNMPRVGQHSQTAGAMEVDKSQLLQEINDWKLKAEELRVAKDEKEARICELEARLSKLELEKVQLVNTCTERLQALKDVTQEKDQLLDELQAGRSDLAGLAEAFEDLEKDYQGEIEEVEHTANRLKMQLKCAQAELKQARTALKTMEGSAGSALEAARRMQKRITAKRGQIDALQSKIKFLEEAVANTAQEKHYLREENCQLSEKLSCIRAENIRTAGELEILRSQGKWLKERLCKMETALDKACMQFAEWQGIIQQQEQELMRFRLQHTLDIKELQGPGYSSAAASGRVRPVVPLPPLPPAVLAPSLALASPAPQVPSKLGILREEPLQDLKRILQELTSSDSDILSVDLCGSGGRKSPLATMRNAVDLSCSHTADLQSQDVSLPFTSLGSASLCSAAPGYTSSPRKVSGDQRDRAKSPVHLLLTTPPDGLGSAGGAATAPQRASQPLESSKHTPRRLQNKMESLENLVESLQIKSQGTSSVIRTQEVKTKKSQEKEKKLSL